MKIWAYNLGEWVEDGYCLSDCPDGEEHDGWIRRNGFNVSTKILGREDSISCEYIMIHEGREKNVSDKFLCDFHTPDSSFLFLISNVPSYIIFLKEYRELFLHKPEDFVPVGRMNKYINRSKITEVECMFNADSEAVVVEIDGCDSRIVADEWDYYKDKDGKVIFRDYARTWVRNNLNISF